MSLITGMLTWAQTYLVPLGPLGLFVIAFTESSFSPIPVELLLIPLVLAAPQLGLVFALVATVGSVSGAILGYAIGKKGGRPVLLKLTSEKKVASVQQYFDKYGDWAIGIAAFTPIPYKLFTIAAGIFNYKFKNMLVVSLLVRGARFFLLAGILMLYGEVIVATLETYFGIFSLLVVAGGIGIYAAVKSMQKK